jgi:RimJ/RimL family protein N-acetyltransferase
VAHVLQTERLLLRPWSADDVALLSELSSIPRVTRYISDGQTWSAVKAIAVSDAALGHWAKHGFGWRVVAALGTGADIGLLALNLLGEGTPGLAPDELEIGWWLRPEQWGRGYSTEAARAVASDAFTALGVPQLTARIHPDNRASLAVARHLGMEFAFNTVAPPGVPVGVWRLSAPPGTPGDASGASRI